MKDNRSDVSPVYHVTAEDVTSPPRRFALIEDYDDETGTPHRDIAYYGLAFPDGGFTTLRPNGKPHGLWADPTRLCNALGLQLIWIDPTPTP